MSGKFSVCIIAVGRVKSDEKNIPIWGGKGSNWQNNSEVGIKSFMVSSPEYTMDSSIFKALTHISKQCKEKVKGAVKEEKKCSTAASMPETNFFAIYIF